MPSRYRDIVIREFGGLNEDENPHSLEIGELVVAQNCCRIGGTIGTRFGIERDPDTYTSALPDDIQGIYEYRINQDGTRYPIVVANGNVYEDATALTKAAGVTITAGQDNVWTFASHKDRVYAAGGATNDTPWYWAGSGDVTEVVFQNSSSADIDCKYILEKWNYGFLAGMNGTAAEDNPMVVRYSQLGDMTVWPAGNTIGGSSFIGGFSSFGGEFITGLADHTDNNGDWLLVLTNRRLYSVLQTSDYLAPFYVDSVIQNGCVHQRAFVPLGTDSGDAIYMSEYGIHSLRQSQQFGSRQDKFLSWKIRHTFRQLRPDRLKYTVGAYWPDEGLILFAVTTGANSTHDLILALDVKDVDELNADTARWYKWTITGKNINAMASMRTPDNAFAAAQGRRGIYVGTTAGDVGRFSRSLFYDFAASAPYAVEIQTAHSDLGVPSETKAIGDAVVDLQPGGTYKPLVRPVLDFGAGASSTTPLDMQRGVTLWDQFQWDGASWTAENLTLRDRVFQQGLGNVVGWSFTHAGSNEPFRIARMVFQARSLGASSEDLVSATE